MIILVYIILFGIFCYKFCNYKIYPAFSFVALIYLGSMISAFYLWNFTSYFNKSVYSLDIYAIIFHVIIICIMLLPIRSMESNIRLPNTPLKSILPLILFLILISIISIFDSLVSLSQLSSISVIERRTMLIEGVSYRSQIANIAIIGYLINLARVYWFLSLILFFYISIKFPNKKLIRYFLLFSSFSKILDGVVFAAREHVLLYIFLSAILYFFWSRYLKNGLRTKFKAFLLILSAVGLFGFIYITVERFATSSHFVSPLESFFSYYGQGFVNFSNFFQYFPNGLYDGKLTFPFFAGGKADVYNLSDKVNVPIQLNSFGTFLGSWVVDLGVFLSLLPVFGFLMLIILIKNMNRDSIYYIIFLMWIYKFFFSGLFFFNDKIDNTRVVAIVLLIIFNKLSKIRLN